MSAVEVSLHDIPIEVPSVQIHAFGCGAGVERSVDFGGAPTRTFAVGGDAAPAFPCTVRVYSYDGSAVLASPPIEVAGPGAVEASWSDLQPVDALPADVLLWIAVREQGLLGSGRTLTNEGSRGPGRRVLCELPTGLSIVPDPGYVQLDGELVKIRHGRFRAVTGPAWVEFADMDRHSRLVATLNTDCTLLPGGGPIWIAPRFEPLERVYVVSESATALLDPDVLTQGLWSLPINSPGPVAVYVHRDRWYSTTLNIPEWFPAILALRLDDLQPSDPPPGLIE